MSKHAAHRKHIKENRGGRDDRPAGTPGATPLVRLGWYTHGCGQWVHDKLAPCSVCPRPRKRKRK